MPPAPDPCIILDFDGTLTRHGTYLVSIVNDAATGRLREALSRIDAVFRPKAARHELTVHEEHAWGTLTFDAYVEHGLTTDAIDAALRDVQMRPHAAEFLAHLDRMRVPCAVVSYGFKPFIERVLQNNGVRLYSTFVYAVEFRFDEHGRMCGYEADTYVVPERKGEVSRDFARMWGTPDDRIYAVGDGEGDRFIGGMRENRLGIFETEDRLRKNAHHFGDARMIGESFWPAAEWLCARAGLPPLVLP